MSRWQRVVGGPQRQTEQYGALTVGEPKPSMNVVRLTESEIANLEKTVRQKMPKLPLRARQGNFAEVELGFDEDMAVQEAKRCLKCWTLH